MIIKIAVIFFVLIFAGCRDNNNSDDFNKGIEEYKKGNMNKAYELYKKACDGGDALGCSNLQWLKNKDY